MNHRQLIHTTRIVGAVLLLLGNFVGIPSLSVTGNDEVFPKKANLKSQSSGNPAVAAPTIGPGKTPSPRVTEAQPTSVSPPLSHASSAAPSPAQELLVKAASRMEQRDLDGAILLLHRYLQISPDSMVIRVQLAEWLFQAKRLDEARWQFQWAVRQLDEQPDLPPRYRLQSHSRLMEIAQDSQERFEEELHRGIGLLILGEKKLLDGGPSDATLAEIWGKAQTALQLAARFHPQDARPPLYLAELWWHLQQPANARLALERATALALSCALSPAERTRLAQRALEWMK